ncbi:hypothetical protein B0T25DRAFT_609108 [Lasiosphaeria hispida]|uniref:Uncharacterized protein n=1 Tax=Lasiosphaeria hispida TaxID=260671 RepID=A0AAJ0HDY4_9PEZI|nr:hypothetical protein B0T25DRAFT_609108 [Lasiosphaeria hispida]
MENLGLDNVNMKTNFHQVLIFPLYQPNPPLSCCVTILKMESSRNYTTFIFYYRPPGMAEQLLQRLANHALDEMSITRETQPIHQVNTRDDSQHPIIIRTMANGAFDMRARGGSLDLEQLDLVVRTVTEARVLEVKSRALEAKSRAICNMVVSVLAMAALALVAFRRQP